MGENEGSVVEKIQQFERECALREATARKAAGEMVELGKKRAAEHVSEQTHAAQQEARSLYEQKLKETGAECRQLLDTAKRKEEDLKRQADQHSQYAVDVILNCLLGIPMGENSNTLVIAPAFDELAAAGKIQPC